MKKILLVLILLCVPVYSYEVYTEKKSVDYQKILNLSQKQVQKFEQIEEDYGAQIAKLNADILLKDMHIAQLRVDNGNYQYILGLKHEMDCLKGELGELSRQKNEELMSGLNFVQKIRFRKYLKKQDA